MCLISVIVVLQCMRPQVILSPHSESLVIMRESFIIHIVSLLVQMVLYMYVTVETTDFRYFRVIFCKIIVSSVDDNCEIL